MKIKELFLNAKEVKQNPVTLQFTLSFDKFFTAEDNQKEIVKRISKVAERFGFANVTGIPTHDIIHITMSVLSETAVNNIQRVMDHSQAEITSIGKHQLINPIIILTDIPNFALLFTTIFDTIHIIIEKPFKLKDLLKNISNIHGLEFKKPEHITGGLLSVLKVKGLKYVEFEGSKIPQAVENILNKYLENSRNVMDCQEELMDNNFEEYASL